MVHSTANAWKIGLAVAALALPMGQLPALADDEPSEPLAVRHQPLEPKSVPIILLPPADDAVFAPQRPALADDVPVIIVQTAGTRAIAPLRTEPEKIQDDTLTKADARIEQDTTTLVESPPTSEPPPRVASLPPVVDAAIASPRPEPEQARTEATPVVIPALPGRSPFRQTAFKSEIVQAAPVDTASVQPQTAEPFPASIEPVEAAPENDRPPIKRLLDKLQFWKK
jgi:hypothetical protein